MDYRNELNPTRFGFGRWVGMIAFALLIVVGGLISVELAPAMLPEQASAEAQNTDALFTVLIFVGGMVFFLVQGLLLYSVISFRAKPGDNTDGPPVHGNTTLEIVWTIIPAIVVVVLAVLSVRVWNDNTAPKSNENLVNGVTVPVAAQGQRYVWSFNYETPEMDADGQPITLTSDVLHTYVGQNVKIDLSTADVIHSFWIPAMRIKQDLLPGRTTEVRFTPIEPEDGFQYTDPETGTRYNEYRIVCAELCGGGHGQMYSTLIVHETEEAYLANFYDEAVFAALNPPEDPVALGQQVLSSGAYPCANCHVLDSMGWAGLTGPTLNGIGDRAARRVDGMPGENYIAQSIRLPNEYIVAGYAAGLMNHFGPTEEAPPGQVPYAYMPREDLVGIVAFLCTQTDSGDAADTSCNIDLTDPEATTQYLSEVIANYE